MTHDWLADPEEEPDDVDVDEYDIVSSPNDWNVSTISSFVESGAVKVPGFQRNYVWDMGRASKLIESLLLGLPVPQVFLYEESRNSFLVIDGQQRLLSIYFFLKQRFPRKDRRSDLRSHLLAGGGIPPEVLHNDEFFEPFRLKLPKQDGRLNRFHRKTYPALDDHKITLDLRTIRAIVVKQTSPAGDSSIYEIFSRLNTGGVNLAPQEIRASLYHSAFMEEVISLNDEPRWRRFTGLASADPRMRDVEIILRAFALARSSDGYSGSMTSFVNGFCREARGFSGEQRASALAVWSRFFASAESLEDDVFRRGGKFSGILFATVFAAVAKLDQAGVGVPLTNDRVAAVAAHSDYIASLQEGSTKTANVQRRLGAALSVLG